MRVFLDTNIVIDFCAKRNDFFQPAATIIDMAFRNEIAVVISSLTFINVAYILRKVFPKDVIALKLEGLAKLCDIAPINQKVIKAAIARNSKDFEDCVQCLSAMEADADIIVTRDPKGFVGSPLPSLSPDDFLEKCR